MIEIRNVWKSYGDKTTLENLSLDIPQGEIFAVVGPSGVGKSVLLELLAGLTLPDRGEIRIGSCRLNVESENCACHKVQAETGFMFQGGALFDFLTVFENVALPLKERNVPSPQIRESVLELLEDLDLAEAQGRYPHQLSGGMIKRVALARAVVHRPKILLVDEPTSGLDPARSKVTFELIRKLHKKYQTTVVIVTHDVKGGCEYVDRVGLLYRGSIAVVEQLNGDTFPVSDLLRKFLEGKTEEPASLEESRGAA